LAIRAKRSRLNDVKGVVPSGMVGKEYLKQLVYLHIREAVEDLKRLDQNADVPRRINSVLSGFAHLAKMENYSRTLI